MDDVQKTIKIHNFYKFRKIKIILWLIFMPIFVVSSIFAISGCANTQNPLDTFDGNYEGAYFITDDSYAEINAKTTQNMFRCVIVGNKMMLSGSENNVYYVYDIVHEGNGFFSGTSITGAISFWFEGSALCIDYDSKTLRYEKDKTYDRVEGETITLNSPQNINSSSGVEGLGPVTFQWDYQSDYGYFGAAVEIKTKSSQEFVPLKMIERVYMNMFTVQLDCSNFETGENYVRLYHIGGPDITNDNSIIVYENSDYAIFHVIVDESGKITVRQ